MYNHPEEVWDIVSCPTDENLLFTSHSPGITIFSWFEILCIKIYAVVSGNPLIKKATLWRKPAIDLEDGNQHHNLTRVVTLETEGIKK